MDTSIAELVKGVVAALLLWLSLNVIAIIYDTNQANDYQKQVAQLVQKRGRVDGETIQQAQNISVNDYGGRFSISPDTKYAAQTDANLYEVPATKEVNGHKEAQGVIAISGRGNELFEKTSDLNNTKTIKPVQSTAKNADGKTITMNKQVQDGTRVDLGEEVWVPLYEEVSADRGHKTVIEPKYQIDAKTGKKRKDLGQEYLKYVIIKHATSNNGKPVMANKDLFLMSSDVHPYGSEINYWVHINVPWTAFSKYKKGTPVAVHNVYMTKTTSQYGKQMTVN